VATPTPTPEHPNLPRRGALALMFIGISLSGILGGLIAYGLVMTSCADEPTRAQRILAEEVPGYVAHVQSCTVPALFAALAGTIVIALGAAVVAVLMMRAQSEWKGHAPAKRVNPS
jgi:hypothetical protein